MNVAGMPYPQQITRLRDAAALRAVISSMRVSCRMIPSFMSFKNTKLRPILALYIPASPLRSLRRHKNVLAIQVLPPP